MLKRSRFLAITSLMIVHFTIGYAAAAPRDVQIREVNFQTGVIELFNFGASSESMNGWQFCTFDETDLFEYSSTSGLNGRSVAAGGSFFIHTLNDAPVAANRINVSAIANQFEFALPVDRTAYALSLYGPGFDFTSAARMIDHVMWDTSGGGALAFSRADVAVNAGLWTGETHFVTTTASTVAIRLNDLTGGLLHGPASYDVIEPPSPREVQIRFVDFQAGTIELHNFGESSFDLSGWRFSTSDANETNRDTAMTGLNGRSIAAGGSFFVHTLNDAPVDPTRINISALGGTFALPLSNAPYALSLYNNNLGGFTTPAAAVDFVMWDDGTAVPAFEGRADVAVSAGLWSDDDDFVQTTSNSAAIQLLDETGGFAHDPADYAVLEAALPLPAPIDFGNLSIRLLPIVTGLTSPVDLTHAGDGSGRLYLVSQTGEIRVIESGVMLPMPFLDLSGTIATLNAGFDERGLLGIAFHPNYENNNRFFVRYSLSRPGMAGEPCFGTSRGCHEEILAEYTALSPTQADPASERILFRVDEPEFNHNSGSLAFGADGLLYWGQGDGGGANDGLDNPNLPHGPIGNGQNIETALGSLLRIDVDSAPDPGLEYKVPPGNPFVGVAGVDEIFAYGFRNPFKISFDDGIGGTGDLIVADVGQGRIEEIDIVTVGGNYGWVTREGNQCFDPFASSTPLPACVNTGPFGEPLVPPFAEYDHANIDGISIIGGFVHRGSEFPGLNGRYVFGDFSTAFAPANGKLYHLDYDAASSTIFEFRNGPDNVPVGLYIKGFGEDANGELYLLASTGLGPFGTGGSVLKIVPLKGDMNGSGGVEMTDIAEFVAVLLGTETDANKVERADMNGSGAANGDDTADFVAALLP